MNRPAYTDAPRLHANGLIGGLHLLFWLFVHPAAWASHLAGLDPALPPDVTITELRGADWRNPALRRLLLQGYGAWLLISGPACAAALWLAGIAPENIAFGIASGVAGALIFGLLLGLTVSIAVGIAGTFSFSLMFWVAFGVSLPLIKDQPGQVLARLMLGADNLDRGDGLVVGIAYAVAIAVVAGLIGGVASSLAVREARDLAARQIGGIVVGVAINVLVYVVTIGAIKSGAVNVAISVFCSLGFGMFARRPARRWFRAAALALVWGLIYLSLIRFAHLLTREAASITGSVASAATGCIWLACFFALPAVLARRSAGAWAGAVAGAFGMGGISLAGLYVVATSASGTPFLWPILPLSAACVAIGFTQGWWRPVLTYPLLAAFNLLLYRADEQSAGRGLRLRAHSAFWDEHQRLRLRGLDAHLLLALERAPAEGEAAAAYLRAGRQRWATLRARLELEARQLEGCRSLEELAAAGLQGDGAGLEAAGGAGALLRSFGRISQDCAAALQQASSYNQRLLLSAAEERLDGLLRELGRSHGHDAIRFQPIALRWREIIAERRQELAETVEQQQLIDSPYVIGVPLTAQQAMFVGRADISARIESLVLDRQCPPLLLYGQRRMGKTSLLNNLARLLPSAIVPMFVDLQGPATLASDHAGLLAALARAMAVSARRVPPGRPAVELPPINRQELAADPFPCFDEWLDEVEAALGERTILLTLDEFEALEGALDRGHFDEAAVLGMLRHTIQHRPRFKLMLAGSHTLDEAQRWASYLINVQALHIGYLSRDETSQLVERPLPDFPLAYTPDASARVFELTSGHPALVQLLCAEIVAVKNAQPPRRRRLATIDDVEEAVPAALERGSFFFADLQRNQIDEAGVAMLRGAAAAGENAILDLGRDPAERAAVELLLRRDVLARCPEAPGGYRFQVELIRRWFAGAGAAVAGR